VSDPFSPPAGSGSLVSSPAESRGHPDFARPPAGAPGGPPPASSVALPVEEYQRLRSLEKQLEEFQKQQQAALEMKETERLRALAEKGQIEEALSQQRKAWEQKHAEALARSAQLEQQIHAERTSAAITEALQGRAFVGDSPEQRAATAAMVRRLLLDEFETVRDSSGALVVREKTTGRPAAEALRERLNSPQFGIFFAPSSRGGSGSEGSWLPANSPPTPPGSLGAIVTDWRNRQSKYQSFGLHPVS
jgi:hypothetical protein